MKKRPLFSLLTGSVLLLSGGCGFLPGGDQALEPTVSSGEEETPTPEIPLASVDPLPAVDMAALGLVQPVLPDQRLQALRDEKGRPNPFALIEIKASVPTSTPPSGTAGTGTTGPGQQSATQSGGTTGVPGQPSGTQGSGVGVTGSTGTTPWSMSPPPPPSPDDARATVVSGIIEIGRRSYAIVKAPGEPVARNVTVGDRLSNGRVVVRAINPYGQNPNVVLEQYGDSVVRPVGSPASPPPDSPSSEED